MSDDSPQLREARQHFVFVDWLKAVGMFLIVYGHCGGHGAIGNPVAPVNVKQLGVAFFVCGLGFLLARENRQVLLVLFNRLFEIYLIGIAAAIALSIIMFINIGDINESNYLPFMLGANVLFDAFPANPTTWYIGTYLHILLFWAILLRHITVSIGWFAAVLVTEILIRAWLMEAAGDFVAYQALPNWLLVLYFGYWMGQQPERASPSLSKLRIPVLLGLAVASVFAWLEVTDLLGLSHSNPFGRAVVDSDWTLPVLTSLLVTAIYLYWTYLAVLLFRACPQIGIVQFLSRNTLFVFIVHMPLIYALNSFIASFLQGPARVVAGLCIYYLALAVISEGLMRLVRLKRLRDFAFSKCRVWLEPSSTSRA